jgi:hypothetical protein
MKTLFYNNQYSSKFKSISSVKTLDCHNRNHNCQKHICKIAQSSAILFDYVDLYSKYICVHPVEQTSTINNCIQQIIVPSIDEQYQVVKAFSTIAHQLHHMHDLEGIILKLLITHENEPLQSLLSSLEEYNASIELIKNIVAYTNDIPIPSIETPFSN